MKDNNNKGFNLIEILATMVILAIVSTIGIVSVNRLIKQSREHFYKSQQQQMVLAAQSYANDNRNILPKNVGGMIKVDLKTLRDKNYLKEDIVDQDKNPCDKDNSYVTIYKSNRSDYKYRGYLECPACRKGNSSTCYTGDQKTKPAIDIKFTPFNNDSQGNALFEDNKNITIKMNAIPDPTSNPDIKIASYSYKIYVNNELRFDSGTKIDNKRNSFTITEQVIKYIPGTVKVVATVTNTDGSTTSKTDSYNYNDAHVPLCGRVTYEGQNAMTAYDSQTNPAPTCGTTGYKWMNIATKPTNRLAWIVCNDLKGIGCAQHEFSQSFTSDGHDDKINIRDKNGKSYDCTVKKCIDKTSSEIIVTFYKATSGGGTSGSAVKTYTISPQRSNVNYTQEATYDSWLNKKNYPDGVVVKVQVKDVTSDIKTFTWKINPKNQSKENVSAANTTIKTKANLSSGKTEYWINEDGVRKQDITVVDNAGNSVNFVLTLWIDKTPPQVPVVNMRKWNSNTAPPNANGLDTYDGSWFSGRVFTFASGGEDKPDVSHFDHYEFKTTGETKNESEVERGTRNIEAQGTSYIQYRSCDVAENCSDYSANSTIRLDREPPDCEISKHDSPSANGVTLKTKCTDAPAKNTATSSGVKTCREDRPNIKTDQTHTVVDYAENSNTCSVNVYSQQRRTCDTCKRCKSAPCETYVYCQHSDCGTDSYTAGPKCAPQATCSSGYSKTVTKQENVNSLSCVANEWYTCSKTKSCRTSGCGCELRSRSCSDCGCEDWGKWKNTYSNSCSGDGKSAECRTMYH